MHTFESEIKNSYMPIKIYMPKGGKVESATQDIKSLQMVCENPYKRGFMLVRVRECDTEAEDCLPLYDLLTIHHEALLTTDEGVHLAMAFTDQNSHETAYLALGENTYPFAVLNYEEHKIWCAEFNEPAPTLAKYIMEALQASAEKPTVNSFVQNPDGSVEFFNGIPMTETSENRFDESEADDEFETEEEEEE